MSLKAPILILLFASFCALLLAQKEKKIYLDANFKALKNEKRAVYYELREGIGRKRDFVGKATTYTLDGKRLQFVFMKDGLKEGSYMSFNNEDFTSVKGQYISGNKVGCWFNVDPNGDYIKEVIYALSGDELERIDLKANKEVYYEEPDVPASYDKGNFAWNQHLRKSLIYPRELFQVGISGEIEVHFRINKQGKFNGYHVINSPHPLLTNAIVRTVLNSGKWQGAIKNNQLVNSIFIYRSSYNLKDLKK